MVKRFLIYHEGNFRTESDIKARWLGPSDMKFIENEENTFWKLMGEMMIGNRCIGLIKDNEVLSYLWVNDKYLEYYGIKKALKHNECYLYNAHTKPDKKGNGYAGILRSKCYKILKDKDTFYSITDLDNESALRFKEKIKAEIIESYRFISIWKFKYLKRCRR